MARAYLKRANKNRNSKMNLQPKRQERKSPNLKLLLYVGLQARLFLVVIYEERQVFGPVVLKASRQIHVHTVLSERGVEVCVKIPRVLCRQDGRSHHPNSPEEPLL
jgi:hypothetical protein